MHTASESRLPNGERRSKSCARRPSPGAGLRRDTEARREQAVVDRLLSQANHDLRTPLTSIQALAEIMLDSSEMNAETTRRFLSIILEESRRLGRVVDGFLEVDLPEIAEGAGGHGCERRISRAE